MKIQKKKKKWVLLWLKIPGNLEIQISLISKLPTHTEFYLFKNFHLGVIHSVHLQDFSEN